MQYLFNAGLAMIIYVVGQSFGQICVNNGLPEDISALSHFTTRGMYGKYYPDVIQNPPEFTPTKVSAIHFDRVDAMVNLLAGKNSVTQLERFHESVHSYDTSDRLFIRWEGRFIAPCSGMYTFAVVADDCVKLDVDGEILINDWTLHAARFTPGEPMFLEANEVHAVRIDFYENTGHMTCNMQWLRPGYDEFELIPSEYLVPATGAEVLVTKHNVIVINPDTGIQVFEVRLSEKPYEDVRVNVLNRAGQDLFGVDVCYLIFTPENWETPQKVHVSPILSTRSTRQIEDTMYIELLPDNEIYTPSSVLVTEPKAPSSTKLCIGFGDPHYTTFDGRKFDFYHQGMYTLVRDYPGFWGIQTYLQPCDNVGARVSCTFLGYIRYGDTDLQLSMNQEDLWDDYIKIGTLKGEGSGMIVKRESNSELTITLPNGIFVKCNIQFYKKQRTDGTHWRYLNFYVSAPSSQFQQVQGLCGNCDNDATNDPVEPAALHELWGIQEDQWIKNGSPLPSVTNPNPPTPSELSTGYTSEMEYKDFNFDPECNEVSQGSTAFEEMEPLEDITPRVLDNEYSADYTTNAVEDASESVIATCNEIVNQEVCPSADAESIAFHRQACILDTVNAQMDEATIEAAGPLKEMCKLSAVGDCTSCTALQACNNGECQTVQDQCGVGCGTHGNCVDGVCECEDTWIGEFCRTSIGGCLSSPCQNGGVCSQQGLQYTCSCPTDGLWTGVLCEIPTSDDSLADIPWSAQAEQLYRSGESICCARKKSGLFTPMGARLILKPLKETADEQSAAEGVPGDEVSVEETLDEIAADEVPADEV
eukprot:CFRG7138T1